MQGKPVWTDVFHKVALCHHRLIQILRNNLLISLLDHMT
ncbi:Uncharacterised protein [Vibrio cholerae]|nr:Uncharacterised protein [Vibrio cholerae]CSD53790.1 Uncharacterised protein [Vibrio cholerae]CSI54917.1 Uncharacterised protein [Vibrio cholerae]CSI63810.1 Uncharacterised protein [Vibrio cholerae]